jgi:predicted ATP-grasp superfamily ATP-dependent carboligase
MDPTWFDDGGIIIPTSDATLAAVSRHKTRLAEKFTVACPDWEITQKFLEKKITSVIANRVGVPSPKTFLPHSREEVNQILEIIQFPALAKPSQSHLFRKYFNRKMTMVQTPDELIAAYQDAESVNVELMIQEFIPGEDSLGANYNAYYWEGQPILEFTAQKLRSAPPVMGSPSALISSDIQEIKDQGRKILGNVGYSGFACSEFKFDPRDGHYKLIEVNARHNLSSFLAVSCGLNFPWIEYQHLTMGRFPQQQGYQKGIYWVDISRDVASWIPKIIRGEYGLVNFTQPYLREHVFAILNWGDIRPAMQKTWDTIRWAIGKPDPDE